MGIFSEAIRKRRLQQNLPFLVCLVFVMVYYTVTWPNDPDEEIHTPKFNLRTDLIISSYIRGGGDLVGEVLGRREDTFYTYEPLFVKSTWKYYKDNATVCKIFDNSCVETDSLEVQKAMEVVPLSFSCKTSVLTAQFYHPRWDNGGPPWRLFHQCLRDGKDGLFCNRIIQGSCEHASNRVVKTNRVSVRLLGDLLKSNESIKVIHIFRDPRGIINSRMKTSWYPGITSPESMKSTAEGLCNHIEDDITEGQKLLLQYPNRFKLILFEDFQANIDYSLRQLLRFLNVRYSPQERANVDAVMTFVENKQYDSDKESPLREIPVNHEDSGVTGVNPFGWRETMDASNVRIIDGVCSGLYKKLGYNVYENEEKLRDIN